MLSHTPTTDELRNAFRRAGLWRQGWSFAAAIAQPALCRALTCLAVAIDREAHPNHVRAPRQRALFPEKPR